MLLLLFIYVVLRSIRKIYVYLISTLVNKNLYYYVHNIICNVQFGLDYCYVLFPPSQTYVFLIWTALSVCV